MYEQLARYHATFPPTSQFDVSFHCFLPSRRVALARRRGHRRKKRNDGRESGVGGKETHRASPLFLPGHLIAAHYCTQDVPASKRFVPAVKPVECQVPGYARQLLNAIHYPARRAAKSNLRPFACQPGNGVSSYHHNRMTRAVRAENPRPFSTAGVHTMGRIENRSYASPVTGRIELNASRADTERNGNSAGRLLSASFHRISRGHATLLILRVYIVYALIRLRFRLKWRERSWTGAFFLRFVLRLM